MSYRALKRLLGETSLERKCRFFLGGGVLILISASFWLYAWQTERLAFQQTLTTGRLLIDPLVAKRHMDAGLRAEAMKEFQDGWESHWPEEMKSYQYRLLKPEARNAINKPNAEELTILRVLLENPEQQEVTRLSGDKEVFHYYGAIRVSPSCVGCHPTVSERAERGELKVGDILAVAAIQINTEHIKSGVHVNRAFLISNALVTALLIMLGSYLIIRYVVVKPVKHLKDVSDAISAGQINVRSEIQTGDEFEDLSYAFNRMLRNLVSMQERLQKMNESLDLKVDQLARANMALFESNRIKSDFLATVSHELRTPLNSILGFSDVLLSGPPLNDKQLRWVHNIQDSGKQLLALINDILDLAKVEAGKMTVRPERFALIEVTEGLLNMFRPLADKKNLALRSSVSPDLPLLFQDAGKIRQILSNLLSNAIKFTPEGGRVSISAAIENERLVLEVADTGVGIAPSDQSAVFEKFRQSANPLTREQSGTGLGLSIVRELSKLIGGDVSLESEVGRGSTFRVQIPMQLTLTPDDAVVDEADKPAGAV
jgi:signal transduction histidine kinase